MLKQSTKDCKNLLACLDRMVTSNESMHQQLYEKEPGVYDIEEIGKLFKVQLKGKAPPCVIGFKCEGEGNRRVDLRAYWSDEFREPGVDANDGSLNDVGESLVIHFLFTAQEENSDKRDKNLSARCLHARLALPQSTIYAGMQGHHHRHVQVRRKNDVACDGCGPWTKR